MENNLVKSINERDRGNGIPVIHGIEIKPGMTLVISDQLGNDLIMVIDDYSGNGMGYYICDPSLSKVYYKGKFTLERLDSYQVKEIYDATPNPDEWGKRDFDRLLWSEKLNKEFMKIHGIDIKLNTIITFTQFNGLTRTAIVRYDCELNPYLLDINTYPAWNPGFITDLDCFIKSQLNQVKEINESIIENGKIKIGKSLWKAKELPSDKLHVNISKLNSMRNICRIPCINCTKEEWSEIKPTLIKWGYQIEDEFYSDKDNIEINGAVYLDYYNTKLLVDNKLYNQLKVDSVDLFLKYAAILSGNEYEIPSIQSDLDYPEPVNEEFKISFEGIELKPGMTIGFEDPEGFDEWTVIPTTHRLAVISNSGKGFHYLDEFIEESKDKIEFILDLFRDTKYIKIDENSIPFLWQKPKKIVLTKKEIAEKFGIEEDQLEIKD